MLTAEQIDAAIAACWNIESLNDMSSMIAQCVLGENLRNAYDIERRVAVRVSSTA
jgi:hypothetical protein